MPWNCWAGCANASRPAACRISDRGSGIPASHCRAGHSVAIGGRMACPSGRTPASSPRTAKITVTRLSTRGSFWRPSRAVCKWTPPSPSPPTSLGQGKWYPGEPLPRWAFGCHWRKDGVPIWEDASLIAEDGKDYGYTAEHARQFLEALTRRLQMDTAFTIAAYEDVFYYLWKERKLPVNVDPLDPKLADPIERARLAR